MSPNRRRKPLLCRLNLWHSYEWKASGDGQRYKTCKRCGKDKYDAPMTRGDSIG